MISIRLKEVILEELGLSDFDFDDTTKASDVPGWDSLRHVGIILAVERAFRTRLRTSEILRLETVSDLQRLLDVKLGPRGSS